jgi:hypothetical protein
MMHELIADPSLHTRCGIDLSKLDPHTNTAITSSRVIKVNLTGNVEVTCAACLEKGNLMVASIDCDNRGHSADCDCSKCKREQTRERHMTGGAAGSVGAGGYGGAATYGGAGSGGAGQSWCAHPRKVFPGSVGETDVTDITRTLRGILLDELRDWSGVTICPAPRGEIRLVTRQNGLDFHTTITLETKT